MNITLGIFKKAFPVVTAASIVAQLSTGTTKFNYVKVNSDSTETEGGNIFSARHPATTVNAAYKSVVWVHPTDGRIVTTLYKYSEKTPMSPVESITTFVDSLAIAPFILVDGVAVALCPFANAGSGFGGVHIKTILGVDYLYGYRTKSRTGAAMRIERYKLELDMNADQENLLTLAYDTGYNYTDDSDALDMDYAYQIDNPYEDSGGPGIEDAYLLPQANRNIVVNEAGNKIIMFGLRKRSNGWRNYPIFELSDDGGTMSLTELREFNNVAKVDYSPTNLVDSRTGTLGTSLDRSITGCPDPWDSRESTNGLNGSLSGEETHSLQGGTNGLTFLGVSYDRLDDTPIYLVFEDGTWGYGARPTHQDSYLSYSRSGEIIEEELCSGCGFSTVSDTREEQYTYTQSSNDFGFGAWFKIYNASTNIVHYEHDFDYGNVWNFTGAYANDFNGTTSLTVAGQFSQYVLSNYQIVDLSCGLFLFNTIYRHGDCDYTTTGATAGPEGAPDLTIDFPITIPSENKVMKNEYYYLNRDTEHLIYNEDSGETLGSYSFSMIFNRTTSVDGCDSLPVWDCDNPTASCTTTNTYG